MPLRSYLLRRKGIYWFRRAVPEALRAALGKSEIKCSLHTRNAAEAKRLGLRKAQEVERLFEAARARAVGPVPNDQPDPVTDTWVPVQHPLPDEAVLRRAVERYPAHLKQFLADRLLSDLGEGPWDEASIIQERHWATVQRQRWRQALATLDLRLAGQALAFEGFNVIWETARQAPPALLMAAVQAEVGRAELRLRRLEGMWNPLEAASSSPSQASGGTTLAEVLEAYHKERHFSAQRLEEVRTLVRRVGEVCGAGLPVAAFGPAHMLAYKQARMAMPWRMTTTERALPLPDADTRPPCSG